MEEKEDNRKMGARKKEIYGKNGSGNMRRRRNWNTRRKREQERIQKIAGSKYNR